MSDSRRINANLRPEAAKAATHIYSNHGFNTTDAINKSLVLYDIILTYIDNGSEIRVISKNGKETPLKLI